MPSNPWRQASLKLRVLGVLLPLMLAVAATGAWRMRTDSVEAANAAYDRSLLGAIKSLDLNVSTESGGLSVELPYRLFEFFELTATGQVYYRVASSDGLVEIGNPDLPRPPRPLLARQPVFYDASYFGESVRVGAYMRPADQTDSTMQVVIQVAESTASREAFTAGFVRRAAIRDAVWLAVMALAVAAGLAIAMRPLARLTAQTRQRAPDDLRPLSTQALPADVLPLVEAVNQQMARTEQLTAQRRAFIDDASHQLRTPLAVLRAQLDYALRESDPVRKEEALRALSAEMSHAIRATNQLLALARADAQAEAPGPVDLAELIRAVAIEMIPLARAREVDIGVDPDGEATVQVNGIGRPELLRQALLNLTHNALQHGREGGRVTLHARADATQCRLDVVDDGPGVPAHVLAQPGERFLKGRDSRGSGLGLAIAQSVARQHGGRLELTSTSAGTTASLIWPSNPAFAI